MIEELKRAIFFKEIKRLTLTPPEAKRILRSLDDNELISVHFKPHNGKYDYFVSPKTALEIFSSYSSYEEEVYVEIEYLLFQRKNKIKEYIEVYRGKRIPLPGGDTIKGSPLEKLTLSWEV